LRAFESSLIDLNRHDTPLPNFSIFRQSILLVIPSQKSPSPPPHRTDTHLEICIGCEASRAHDAPPGGIFVCSRGGERTFMSPGPLTDSLKVLARKPIKRYRTRRNYSSLEIRMRHGDAEACRRRHQKLVAHRAALAATGSAASGAKLRLDFNLIGGPLPLRRGEFTPCNCSTTPM
jgi:hypothetical protein